MSYASNTSVSVDKSKAEIEKTLMKYGANQFMYGWDRGMMTVAFHMKDRMIRFMVPVPDETSVEAPKRTRYGVSESMAMSKKIEQAKRQKWRALFLIIKAKLEAVDGGISEFEHEFLAHIVLPNKRTVGEWVAPQIAEVYANGKMPKLLAGTVQ